MKQGSDSQTHLLGPVTEARKATEALIELVRACGPIEAGEPSPAEEESFSQAITQACAILTQIGVETV